MNKMNFKILIAALFTFSLSALFISCGGNDNTESKSMTQIQAEEGIPVEVKIIEPQLFTKELSFFAKLRGIKETTEGAKIGGRIEKINFKVGDKVKKGDVIIEFPVNAPGAMYEQAESAFENSRKNYERAKSLLEAGETSQANFDGINTKYLVDKSNYEMQKQLLFIEAPFEGLITEIKVNEKDNVQDKTPLFSIAQLNKLSAKVWANEDEIKTIKKSMMAYIKNSEKIYEGRVSEVAIKADPATQAFYAEIQFDNPGLNLKSGVTADIKIKIYENKNALVIPRNIISQDETGMYIFTAGNGKSIKNYIKTGLESGINIEVTEGIDAGSKIIIKGASGLIGEEKIKVID
ncbi:MAG: efflux RND transporter periplasmic adaptor subunit [Bacteroidetes bacterium]|nr:efflux RND transporter periplasmic adaptor subunit [Bacteroidota bacterium]